MHVTWLLHMFSTRGKPPQRVCVCMISPHLHTAYTIYMYIVYAALEVNHLKRHLNRGAVCISVLKCVAVRCSALQCVTVRCSALQCVSVCCSAALEVNNPNHKSNSGPFGSTASGFWLGRCKRDLYTCKRDLWINKRDMCIRYIRDPTRSWRVQGLFFACIQVSFTRIQVSFAFNSFVYETWIMHVWDATHWKDLYTSKQDL